MSALWSGKTPSATSLRTWKACFKMGPKMPIRCVMGRMIPACMITWKVRMHAYLHVGAKLPPGGRENMR